MFGSKKIFAKIMNGKLVIRVGGGYMLIDEFLANYAELEMEKEMGGGALQKKKTMNSRNGMGSPMRRQNSGSPSKRKMEKSTDA